MGRLLIVVFVCGVLACVCVGCARQLTKPTQAEVQEFRQAVLKGDVPGVKRALGRWTSPELLKADPMDGQTPLHAAAIELQVLGCDTTKDTSGAGKTSKSYRAVVKLLVSKGADINAKSKDGRTPLHLAIAFDRSSGAVEMLRLLLARGADVNTRDKLGDTPLHTAASAGNTDIVEALVSGGANVNATDRNGDTPLKVAIAGSRKDIAEVLRRHGGKE